jgi:hypothetical protein
MDKIELTKDQLNAALLQWEMQAREGNWPRDVNRPAEEVAAESADHLWELLTVAA